jgi:hypothetical protein
MQMGGPLVRHASRHSQAGATGARAMSKSKSKKLTISTSHDHDTNQEKMLLAYGRSMCIVMIHQEDFAEFIEGLRTGFPDLVITQSPRG